MKQAKRGYSKIEAMQFFVVRGPFSVELGRFFVEWKQVGCQAAKNLSVGTYL